MICFHGTPIGSVVRNAEALRDRALCLSFASASRWGLCDTGVGSK